jgi:intracellular septation protein A
MDDSVKSEDVVALNKQPTAEAPKRENIWLNIGLNVLIPSVLLSKGDKWFSLDPSVLLVVALAFPVCYGIYDGIARKKVNFFSVLGFVSILITGGIGLLDIDVKWIAIKEAAIPALFGLAVLISLKTKYPLVRTFLYNPELFNVPKIDAALDEHDAHPKFEQLMRVCTYYLVVSFILSAILNFVLAKYCFNGMAGIDPALDKAAYDEAFNAANGRMMALSWVVITIPTMAVTMVALMKLLKGIKEYTGYEMEEVLHNMPEDKKEPEADEAAADSDVITDSEEPT